MVGLNVKMVCFVCMYPSPMNRSLAVTAMCVCVRVVGRIVLRLALENKGMLPTNRFDVKFNVNSFGIGAGAESFECNAPAGGRSTATLLCTCTPAMVARDAPPSLSVRRISWESILCHLGCGGTRLMLLSVQPLMVLLYF